MSPTVKPNSVTFDAGKNTTYLWDKSGAFLGKVSGDLGLVKPNQRQDPKLIDQALGKAFYGSMEMLGVPSSVTGAIKSGTNVDWSQFIKEIGPNIATQAALTAIPGGGVIRNIVKGGAGLASGLVADELLSPEKSMGASLLDNTINTAVGSAIPWATENKIKVKIPGIVSETEGVVHRAPSVTKGTSGRVMDIEHQGQSTNQGTSTGVAQRSTSGKSKIDVSRETVGRQVDTSGPHTEVMTALENEIERLEGINTAKYNAGAKKQVEDAITKNKEALEALNQANTSSSYVTSTTGTTDINTKGQGTTETQGTRGSKGTTQGKTSGTIEGETERVTTHGDQTNKTRTVTTGSSIWERLLTAIHTEKVKDVPTLKKVVLAIGGNTLWDLINNTSSNKTNP